MTDALKIRLGELRRLTTEVLREHGDAGRAAVRELMDGLLRQATPVCSGTAGARPEDRSRYAEIIGDSPAMQEVFAVLDRVAATNLPVLIQGESGTGKELIARAIHQNSLRRNAPFVTENSAAIPETLQESELFGYKKGAFTGADRERKGLFQMADGGTLFLDEVGDMSPAMQKKLLRALQDGEIRPVGGTRSLHVDVRVVSASNRLLTAMVANKQFRQDLYYRLNGLTIQLPPLRDRPEDVPALADHFLQRICGEMKVPVPVLTPAARRALARYRWPGNIRELENEMRRAMALLGGAPEIDVQHLGEELRAAAAG